MRILGAIASAVLIFLILADGFESILQPRRVTRRYRFARLYYVGTWAAWRMFARWLAPGPWRMSFLSLFGPLSLLGIFATWVMGLIVGFGLLNWSLGSAIASNQGAANFGTYLYLSGTTFFTLGYGDVTPVSPLGRIMAVGESGLGFGFLAAMLSYLPALFQAYSRREVSISLLDARAGSPPSASQFLLRSARSGGMAMIDACLAEWERWSAEVLEGQLSFPVLSYYRSQHDNQSWLAALATILDSCALLLTQLRGINAYQAQVTFAIARHAAVDLTLVLRAPASGSAQDRLPSEKLALLRRRLEEAGLALHDNPSAEAQLRELRAMYEPFIQALADRLLMALPAMMADDGLLDNWQRSAWMKPAPGFGRLPVTMGDERHFG